MKNIFKLSLLLFIAVAFTSCEEEEKFPLTIVGYDQIDKAPFVLLNVENSVIDVTQVETSTYGGTLVAPSNNVASYTLRVRRVRAGQATEFGTVLTTDTFPSEAAFTAGELNTAIGISPNDLQAGDRYDFTGTSVGLDGVEFAFNDLDADLQSAPEQRQAYNLQTFISCPFVQSEAIGTYNVVSAGFGFVGTNEFEVIAGANPGQVILVDAYGSSIPFDIVVDVDTGTGIATIEQQPALATIDTGNPGFFPTEVSGTGFYFSCTGFITFTALDTSLEQISSGSVFTFGSVPFIAQKQ